MPFHPDLLAAFRQLSSPVVGDAMDRQPGILGVRPYHGAGILVGRAFTVKTPAGHNLAIHQALDEAEPGDVLVIDGEGALDRALVGELMMSYAKSRGLAGAVVFGAIRDIAYFRSSNFPCFACGNTHRGPFRTEPGLLQVELNFGDQRVSPGDLVLGDEDGVLVIPAARAEEILRAAQAVAMKESADKAAILAGTWDRSWLQSAR